MNDRTRWLLWMERLKINWRSSLFQNFGSFPQTTILAEWLVGLRSIRYEKYCDFRFWLRPKYLSFGPSITDGLEVE